MASTRKRSDGTSPFTQERGRGRARPASGERSLAAGADRASGMTDSVLETIPTVERAEPAMGLLRYALSFRNALGAPARGAKPARAPAAPAAEVASGFRPAFLYVEQGPGSGQLLPIPQGTLVIGRASVSDLRLAHVSVSRRHAQLVRKGDRFYVRDLASQNGTFVNRARIGIEVELHLGDELGIGQAVLRLRGAQDKPAAAAVPSLPPRPEPSPPSEKAEALEVAKHAPRTSHSAGSGRGSSTQGTRRKKRPSSGRTVLMGLLGGFFVAAAIGLLLFKAGILSPRTGGWAQRLGLDAPRAKVRTVVLTSPAPAREDNDDSVKQTGHVRIAKTADQVPPPEPKEETTVEVRPAPVTIVTSENGGETTGATAEAPTKAERADKKEPTTGTAARPKGALSPAVLEAYEAGDVAAAIALAKAEGDRKALAKLRRFQVAYKRARAAVERNDGAGAIKGFTRALRADRRITRGWSEYGETVRAELSKIYTLLGNHHLNANNPEDAEKAFKVALKYNPKNPDALSALGKGGSREARALARARTGGTRASASADAGPGKKKRPSGAIDAALGKTRRRASAIDAAWND